MNLKKPKFWDYNYLSIHAYLLLPVAFIISLLSKINKKKRNQFKIKTICVGNFYIGGTGKTSLCIKINKILNEKKIKSCFVKKFYENQIDEQKLLEKNGKLFLSSKRKDAILEAENENFEIAILDDGLQDKSISNDVSFVCFNTINWIGNGLTIPAGPLRETMDNLKYYNHVFLNGNLENLEKIKIEIFKINPLINIHIGKYKILNLNEFDYSKKYLIFSGIGNHQTFVSTVKSSGLNIVEDIEFPDHYNYKKKDIENIINQSNKLGCNIITTEKDHLRLKNLDIDKIKFIKSDLEISNMDKIIKSII